MTRVHVFDSDVPEEYSGQNIEAQVTAKEAASAITSARDEGAEVQDLGRNEDGSGVHMIFDKGEDHIEPARYAPGK